MTFIKNIYAWVVIARSNFASSAGSWLSLALWGFIFLCFCGGLIRTLVAGRDLKKTKPLSMPAPDRDESQHAAESLSEAIRINSVTGNKEGIGQMNDFLRTRYPGVFEHLNLMPSPKGSLLLRWRGPRDGSRLPVMFCGHLDVVPAGEGWQENPFSGRTDADGYIIGRGAIDCKNVVIGLFEAVDSLIKEGYTPSRDIYLSFGHDEETGGAEGAAKMAESFERRGVRFEAIIDEGGYITTDHFGRTGFPAALIGLGEKGCSYFKITAEAAAGHSSVPPRHTAVGVLAEAICRIEAAPPKARLLDAIDEHIRLSMPAMRFFQRFAVSNLPFSEPLMFRIFRNNPSVNALFRTTLACTQVKGSDTPNVLPGRAECIVSARILQGDTPESIKKYIESLTDDLSCTVESVLEIPASDIADTKSEAYKTIATVIGDVFPGVACIPGIQPITTDSRHYGKLCDNIFKFMPFVLGSELYRGMHGAGERIHKDSLAEGVDLYKRLIKAF